jgi:hypothetical protein
MHRSVHVNRRRAELIGLQERKRAGAQIGREEDVGQLNVVEACGLGGRKYFRQPVAEGAVLAA